MIALSIDNQWTVVWHMWLPYKTNQFPVQHDFLFSSKRPVLVRAWPKKLFSAQSNCNHCRNMFSKKYILMNIKIRVALGVCFSIYTSKRGFFSSILA